MPDKRFAAWFDDQIRQRDWTLVQASEALGTDPSTLSRWSNALAWPGRKNLKQLVAVFGADRDEIEAMIEADRRPFTSSRVVDRNVEIINWDAMAPEEAKLLQRLLRGALDVLDAKERGEA